MKKIMTFLVALLVTGMAVAGEYMDSFSASYPTLARQMQHAAQKKGVTYAPPIELSAETGDEEDEDEGDAGDGPVSGSVPAGRYGYVVIRSGAKRLLNGRIVSTTAPTGIRVTFVDALVGQKGSPVNKRENGALVVFVGDVAPGKYKFNVSYSYRYKNDKTLTRDHTQAFEIKVAAPDRGSSVKRVFTLAYWRLRYRDNLTVFERRYSRLLQETSITERLKIIKKTPEGRVYIDREMMAEMRKKLRLRALLRLLTNAIKHHYLPRIDAELAAARRSPDSSVSELAGRMVNAIPTR